MGEMMDEVWFDEILDGKVDVSCDFGDGYSDIDITSGIDAVDELCERALVTLETEEYFC